jgi:hypothetical protein
MIRNDAPQNEAVLSNVGEVGEFRIRNSAKAFNILSSGLYANKIRAIVRELSTNAVDSHIAAGKGETPFDLHLPSQLEPWFAIRDYGTGLSHEQVVNIYTTYFESTKTASNEFVGCLGLGSKSPFAYTDNFTVTAIKDGRKGIYTAFINEHGVPSIALMMEEDTDEPSGVEVKFSVNDRYDFSKFRQEAGTVFTYFKLRPVVSGDTNFQIFEPKYETKDIIAGVSSLVGARSSHAVMGSIAYPIHVPNAEANLGELHHLLSCGLEIHFEIGELDFQASREGLSYIPQTIEAIKVKLSAVRDALSVVLAKEADAIDNEWKRALFISGKYDSGLWRSAAHKYVTDTKFELFDLNGNSWSRTKNFEFTVDELAAKYNIAITGFSRYKRDVAAKNIKADHRSVMVAQTRVTEAYWTIRINSNIHFYVNDTKQGAVERAKYHWKLNSDKIDNQIVAYILSPADKTKPANTAAFLKALHNPPIIGKVSDLAVKPRDTVRAKDVTILKLEKKGSNYWRSNGEPMVWRDAGKADTFDIKTTFYYLPLSGYTLDSEKYGYVDSKTIVESMNDCGINFGVSTVYGVRKGDIKFIKTQKNWINLEDHIAAVLSKVEDKHIAGMALHMYSAKHNRLEVRDSLLFKIAQSDSPFKDAVMTFKNVSEVRYDTRSMNFLTDRYAKDSAVNPLLKAKTIAEKVANEFKRYPMIKLVDSVSGNEQVIADYINMVDTAMEQKEKQNSEQS